MSLTLAGNHLAYSKSTSATIRPGGYTIHRTDTFRLRISGLRLVGRPEEGMVLRTSAGRTTAGPMSGDSAGRYLITATGRNFSPQLVYCCTLARRDEPIQADGRADAPTTLAAAISWPAVRYVVRDPGGGFRLLGFHIAEGPGEPYAQRSAEPLAVDPDASPVAMAPGIIAWADRGAPQSVHLLVASTLGPGFDAGPVLPTAGAVLRLHVTPAAVAALVRTPSRYELVRWDRPTWAATTVWAGTAAPGPTALGDRTLALVAGGVVQQHVPGTVRRGTYRLRGTGAAVTTDGRRVAVLERRSRRVRGRLVRETAIVLLAARLAPAPAPAPVTP
jgi:hypothetical protein